MRATMDEYSLGALMMNLIALICFMLGGLIQVGGVVYAVMGSDEFNLPVLIGAVIVGSVIETLGIVSLVVFRR